MSIITSTPHVNVQNPLNVVYVIGKEDVDGSIRLLPDEINTTNMAVQSRISGVWNETGIEVAAGTVHLGRELELSAAGNYLHTRDTDIGVDALIPHIEYTDAGTADYGHMPILGAKQIRYEVQSDNSGTFTGQIFQFEASAPVDFLAAAQYMQTGPIAADDNIVLIARHGSHSGHIFYKYTYPAASFTADTEVKLDFDGFLGYESPDPVYITFETESDTGTFSIKTDATVTAAWAAVDMFILTEEDIVTFENNFWTRTGTDIAPTTSGDTLTMDGDVTAPTFLGDLLGTINTATTGVTQSALDNSTKIATTAYVDTAVSVEDLWDRTGTVLSPSTAGDDILTTGDITGANGTFTGTLNVTGDLAVDTDTLFVDVSAGNVGINTSSILSAGFTGNNVMELFNTDLVLTHLNPSRYVGFGQTVTNLEFGIYNLGQQATLSKMITWETWTGGGRNDNDSLKLYSDNISTLHISDQKIFIGDDSSTERSANKTLEIFHASDSQLRLTNTWDVDYSDFTVDMNGDLTIAPSGGDTAITGTLDVTGTATASTFSGDLLGTINTATTGVTQSPLDSSTKIATTAYVDAAVLVEDIWDRTGTTIEPKTAGDDLDMGTGDITATNGTLTGTLDVTSDLTVSAGDILVSTGHIDARGSQGVNSNFVAGYLTGGSMLVDAIQNTIVGAQAGATLTDGQRNTMVGFWAGDGTTTQNFNTYVGYLAGRNVSTGNRNVGIGANCLVGADGTNSTTAVGYWAGNSATGDNCVYLGYEAGQNNTTNEKLFISNDNTDLIEGSFAIADPWAQVHGDLTVDGTIVQSDSVALTLEQNSTQVATGNLGDYTVQHNGVDVVQSLTVLDDATNNYGHWELYTRGTDGFNVRVQTDTSGNWDMSGDVTIAGALDITGDLTVDGTDFFVNASTGNVSVGNDLAVAGVINADGGELHLNTSGNSNLTTESTRTTVGILGNYAFNSDGGTGVQMQGYLTDITNYYAELRISTKGTVDATAERFRIDEDGDTNIYYNLDVSGTTTFTDTTINGNLTLQTTAPTAPIVQIGPTTRSNSGTIADIEFMNGATEVGNINVFWDNVAGESQLRFGTYASSILGEHMYLHGDGSLSLGTNVADGRLTVYEDTTAVTSNGIMIQQEGSGDASLHWQLVAATDINWSAGIDNSHADNPFRIAKSEDVGLNYYMSIHDGDGTYFLGSFYVNNTEFVVDNVTGNVSVGNDLTVDTDTFHVDSTNNKVGIGTTVIPHGGIGYAKLALEGTAFSAANGPHVIITTSQDDYPLFNIRSTSHDNIEFNFDAYYTDNWKSSDLGSNFQITKKNDELSFWYDSGVAQGSDVTFFKGFALDTAGKLTASNDFEVGGASTFQDLVTISSGGLNVTGDTDITGALTATSYGGILEANLLDKTANETITGDWTFSGPLNPILTMDSDGFGTFQFNSDRTAVGGAGQVEFSSGGTDVAHIRGFITDVTNNYGEFQFYTRGTDGFKERAVIDEAGVTLPVGDVLIEAGVIDSRGSHNINSNFIAGYQAGSALLVGDTLNTFVGANAGFDNAGGDQNTFLGYYSGGGVTTENFNTYVGYNSGRNTVGGFRNVGVGANVFNGATTTFSTAVGFNAGGSASGNNCVYLGYEAGVSNTTNEKLFISNDDTDLIEGSFAVADPWLQVHGDLIVDSDLTVDTDTLYVDSTNNSVTAPTFNTNTIDNAKIVYVTSDNASDVLPGWGTGTITLDSTSTYIGVSGDSLTITDDIVMGANNRLIRILATISGQISSTKGIDLRECNFTYTGTSSFISDADLSLASQIVDSTITISSVNGTVFNVVGSGSLPSILMRDTVFEFAGGNIGSIDDMIVIMDTVQFLGFKAGFTFDSLVYMSARTVLMVSADAISTTFMSFDGTNGGIFIDSVAPTLGSDEYMFDFNTTGTYASVSIQGVVISGATDNAFASGSYDQTTVGFKFTGCTYIPDSTANAYLNALDEGGTQTTLDQNVAQRVNATYTEISSERFTITSDGNVEYDGLEDTTVEVIAVITGNTSVGANIKFNFYYARGNSTNTITAVAFGPGVGESTFTTSSAHGYSSGDRVIIEDTTSYDYEYTINSVPSTTTFVVTAGWVATETGSHYQLIEETKISNYFSATGSSSNTTLIAQFPTISTNDVGFIAVENVSSNAEWETDDIQFTITR